MSKKSRQHWQQDNQDYTFNQYSFYLILLGLLITGLLVWYLFLVKGPPIPRTHVVSIMSRPGGELPMIPFQDEDAAAMDIAFPGHERYQFDDLDSFKQNVIEELKADSQAFQEIDTVLIWLSAIGAVRDGRPVILGSARDNLVEFELLLDAFNELKAQNVILLLDAGHGYVDTTAYQDSTQRFDLNQFAKLVQEQYSRHPESPKVRVLINGEIGERPLHSIVRRRSLLGFALEKCFYESEERLWTLKNFHESLNNLTLEWGGVIAPNIVRLEPDEEELKFARPEIVIVKKVERIGDAEKTEEEKTPKPKPLELAADTQQMLNSLDKAWNELQSQQQRTIAPGLIDATNWESLVRQLIELSVDALGASPSTFAFDQSCQKIPLTLQSLDDGWLETIARLDEIWKFTPARVGVESESVLEKRVVTQAYLRAYEIQQRLPHYLAFADSLLWLYPAEDDDAVSRFRVAVIELTERLRQHSPIHADSFAPLQPAKPSLDEYRQILDSVKELERGEQRLQDLLSLIGDNLDFQTRGFQREMVIESFLRLPMLTIQPPEKKDVELQNKYRVLSRTELTQRLTAENPPNPFPRLPLSRREVSSSRRVELYRAVIENWFGAVKSETPLSLRLQNFAYRLAVPTFRFDSFVVRDRTPKKRVVVTRRDQLLGDANYIERESTMIDLGLEVDNTSVMVRCQLLQNGKFFQFADGNPDAAEFSGNPKLVALVDSPPTDPGCRLRVMIVDRLEPNRDPYDEFDIPIRLPSNNAVDLIAEVGGQRNVFRQDATGQPLRPFPNCENLVCAFELQNHWHRSRDVTIALYACAAPSTRTMPGKINDEIREKTLAELRRKSLVQIAEAQQKLPAFNAENPAAVAITWAKPSLLEGQPKPIAAPHGFLCVVEDPAEKSQWKYWLPVFPVENPVVMIDPRMDSGDLKLMVDRQAFFPEARAVELRWRFSDDQLNSGQAMLGVGLNRLQIPVARNVSTLNLKPNSFLYVDVDGWPRKYVFQFNGRQFRTVATYDAEVAIKVGNPEDAENPEMALVPLAGNRDRIRFGTRSPVRTVRLTLSPNVPSDGTFLFSSATDTIRLFETGDPFPLYYPREIRYSVMLNDKAGIIELESRVTDHQLTFADVGTSFQLTPQLQLGARENRSPELMPLGGNNRVEVLFDRAAPQIESFRISNTTSVFPKTPVRIVIEASDQDGVGIDWNRDTAIYLSPRNGSLAELTGEPVPAELLRITGDSAAFEIEAPESLGKYSVGVAVSDRVGNRDEELKANRVAFEVVAKPIPRPPKSAEEGKPTPPKVFTHTLSVTLTASDINNVSELTITLDPPDATAKKIGDTYLFENLPGDKLYTVTASGKLKGGIAAGQVLSATDQVTFPKNSKASQTRSIILKLAR